MDFIAEHINLTRLKLNVYQTSLNDGYMSRLANLSNLTELRVSAHVIHHDAVAYALSHFESLHTIEMDSWDESLTLDKSNFPNHWIIDLTEEGRKLVAKRVSVQ